MLEVQQLSLLTLLTVLIYSVVPGRANSKNEIVTKHVINFSRFSYLHLEYVYDQMSGFEKYGCSPLGINASPHVDRYVLACHKPYFQGSRSGINQTGLANNL